MFAYTISGKWGYPERPWTARAGDFVYEAPGEGHTLVAYESDEPMKAFFIVKGPLIWLDEKGDGAGLLRCPRLHRAVPRTLRQRALPVTRRMSGAGKEAQVTISPVSQVSTRSVDPAEFPPRRPATGRDHRQRARHRTHAPDLPGPAEGLGLRQPADRRSGGVLRTATTSTTRISRRNG
ncbi:hypothetical protein [Streptomyces sp. NPDC001536]|uniref:hypothetical protein n=1 Tax=Streptomyces sp. NPDC001536 TaxID=3364583 RepID=UPI003699C344